MKIAIWFLAAVCSYLIAGFNLAILLSKAIYHQDIREVGSKNPGFTNFKRVYGNKYAWFIFVFDMLKAALPALIFGFAFKAIFGNFQLGAAYAGVFAMLGHAYPVFYKFKGGKGFLVCLATLFFIDWRIGLIAFVIMTVLLLTVKYMSVSTMAALTVGAILLPIFKADTVACILYACCVLFMIYRHKENIKRLIKGEESKWSLKSKKE
ncbi:MAG: glycerol-3-phosphate acyltransferase [Clostridia bacterium]|nr:glycerol-3-phosphate acyltransferase [Clostridia bacterium]